MKSGLFLLSSKLLLAVSSLQAFPPAPRDRERLSRFDGLHAADAAPRPGEDAITEDRLRGHVSFLASDENEGRGSGLGPLEGTVTEYIEAIWTGLGFTPAGDAARSTWRQPFTVRPWSSVAPEAVPRRLTARPPASETMFAPEGHHIHGFDRTDPASFGHRSNEGGLAFSLAGHVTSLTAPTRLEALAEESRATHNLIALVPGSDPALAGEFIVIGAHMDHIGTSRWGGDDRIYNGADDNASGTAGILAISVALARAHAQGAGPARSVLLMLFSGEELGLLGSQHYVSEPTVGLESIKGMINIDMIGRLDPAQVSIFDGGQEGANFFHALHDSDGTAIERIDHDIDRFLARSDQYSFHRRGIPVMFFFEGFTEDGRMNPDYHGRGDHADKIEYGKLTDITRLAYRHLLGAATPAPSGPVRQ